MANYSPRAEEYSPPSMPRAIQILPNLLKWPSTGYIHYAIMEQRQLRLKQVTAWIRPLKKLACESSIISMPWKPALRIHINEFELSQHFLEHMLYHLNI